jgi:hypothetical protein
VLQQAEFDYSIWGDEISEKDRDSKRATESPLSPHHFSRGHHTQIFTLSTLDPNGEYAVCQYPYVSSSALGGTDDLTPGSIAIPDLHHSLPYMFVAGDKSMVHQ